MKLHELSPVAGSTQVGKRKGRGTGSGNGKTGGRGHKGQKARSGGKVRVGFEGGQMPMQRRLPKIGFRSRKAHESAEVLLYQLGLLDTEVVDLFALRAAKLVSGDAKKVKIVKKGEITKKLTIKGLLVTAGAKAAIEAAGGSVE